MIRLHAYRWTGPGDRERLNGCRIFWFLVRAHQSYRESPDHDKYGPN